MEIVTEVVQCLGVNNLAFEMLKLVNKYVYMNVRIVYDKFFMY